MASRLLHAGLLTAVTLAGVAASWPAIDFDTTKQSPSSRPVRVLLAALRDQAPLRVPTAWRLVDSQRRVMARGGAGENWVIQRERDGGRIRTLNPSGSPGPWFDGPGTLEPADSGAGVGWEGRAYRGVLIYVPADSSLLVVNRLDIEDYLRGVVPLEAGTRSPDEHAAVEAQAVAARSYTYTRMLYQTRRHYDVTATTSDQVYRGSGPETFISDLAVSATAGWVLSYNGRVVTAPYHSTCGGTTAASQEIWRGAAGEPYLRPVSDQIPGTNKYYCDISPRFRWERTLSGEALSAAVERYARTYATVSAGPLGAVRGLALDGQTPSGRVTGMTITTDRARFQLLGNDMRYVLRTVGGEILPSTYFVVEPAAGAAGLTRVVIRGQGNGHGVGMCQFGAIGRARAGQDFRAILRAYYPGAQIARAP